MTRRELRLATVAGAGLLCVGGFLVWAVLTQDAELELGENLCPIDHGQITDYALVLLDVSEPLVGGNAEELKRKVIAIADGLDRYGRLSVMDIHDTSQVIVSICRPQNIAECDPKTAPKACRGVEEAYARQFTERILLAVGGFLERQRERSVSPIMEAIKDISTLTEFRQISPGSKSLYVVSDMLQHTPGVYSHYRRTIGSDELARLQGQPFYTKQRPDLAGVNVEILYILRRRNRAAQTSLHKSFWHEYFRAANASYVRLTEMNFLGGDTGLNDGRRHFALFSLARRCRGHPSAEPGCRASL